MALVAHQPVLAGHFKQMQCCFNSDTLPASSAFVVIVLVADAAAKTAPAAADSIVASRGAPVELLTAVAPPVQLSVEPPTTRVIVQLGPQVTVPPRLVARPSRSAAIASSMQSAAMPFVRAVSRGGMAAPPFTLAGSFALPTTMTCCPDSTQAQSSPATSCPNYCCCSWAPSHCRNSSSAFAMVLRC